MEKKIVSIKNLDDCKNFLSGLENFSYTLDIKIQNDNYDCIKYLLQHSQNINQFVDVINLSLPYEMIPKKDFETIYNLGIKFPNTLCNVVVTHRYVDDDKFIDKKGNIVWNLKTVLKANKSIYDVCNFIKKNNFSPFEAYAYVHHYVSTIAKYNEAAMGGTWLSNDQYFLGAFLDLPEVVCMGYASLEKEIIDTLNMPDLKCSIVTLTFCNKDKNTFEKHARCVVKVFDNQYGINQSCYEDPTWDNLNIKSDNICKYAHFAMDKNCHAQQSNDKYNYGPPSLVEMSPKSVKNITDLTASWEYNKSKTPISQLQIEQAFFNVLIKSNPNVNFDKLYLMLSQMAKQSYDEQLSRRFKGNLTQEEPLLSKEMAKNIFDKNKQVNHELTL